MKEPQQPQFLFVDLKGRTVVLTGATRGIGYAVAPGLAAQGVRLILVGRRPDRLAEVVAEVRDTGADAEGVVCNLESPEERGRAAKKIADIAPVVDGVIHNAAIDPRKPLETMDISFFRHVMATNVEPAVDMTRDLLSNLRKSRAGRVLLIGSITLDVGTALLSAYVAAKGALLGLTRSLAHELGEEGITVNCISPGAIAVEKEADRHSDDTERRIISWQSVKRRLVPQDLLGVMCLLLSDAGSAITGQTITVDGGLLHPIADPKLQRPWVQP